MLEYTIIDQNKVRPNLPILIFRLLAQGNTIRTNAWLFRIGRSTMQGLLKEVCQVIVDVLVSICLPILNEDTWKRVSSEYQEKWNMPHCLGALDGRHMALKKPPHSGSMFYNYKKFFSMVLLGICDAYKRFIFFNVGHYGKECLKINTQASTSILFNKQHLAGSFNDASIFMSTDLYRDMQEEKLNIPEPTVLNGTDTTMPYFFVGDNIFALHKHLMKPYPKSDYMTREQQIYNYRISRARITIVCTFGILVNRWKIFDRPLGCSLKTAEKVIIATVLLHNFLITQNLLLNDSACEYTNVNYNGSRKDFIDEQDARILENSSDQREALKDYFNSPAGSVPWQEKYI